MNTHYIRRAMGILAALAGALLAVAAPAAAFAMNYPPPGMSGQGSGGYTPPPPQIHTVVVGGMPGWQIALIAAGAALVAATAAVFFERVRAGQRKPATATA
jgi:hypothetical protein